ncbi:kaempferol 3-O-beta-D-galactosyltransferase [Morus notabilis]|nr:kaempferol 3-O-beta-D-galactosyltransferase [Morus notabilis]
MNSYREINPPALNSDFESRFRSVFNVGFPTVLSPLPPTDTDPTGCMAWLDERDSRSVVYIGFGTEFSPPNDEIIAVVEALEETKLPFLWSLNDNLRNVILPKGFVETRERGKVVPWTPQRQVLAHDSVRVFVTLCGYNSTAESAANGVPMICRPLWAFHECEDGGESVEDWSES